MRAGSVLTVLVAALALALTGCTAHGSGETGVQLVPESSSGIAAGARLDIAVVDSCSEAASQLRGSGQGKIPTSIVLDVGVQTCEFSEVLTITAATSSDQGVLEVIGAEAPNGYGVVSVLAGRPGRARIEISVASSTGDYTVSGEYTVLAADSVELTALCGEHGTRVVGDGVAVLGGQPLRFAQRLRSGAKGLGGYGYHPYDSVAGTIEPGPTGDEFTLRVPAEAQTLRLTSPVDPAFGYTLEVVTPACVDSVQLDYANGPCAPALTATVTIDGVSRLCGGSLLTALRVTTPETCSFGYNEELEARIGQPGLGESPSAVVSRVRVASKGSGPCRIEVSVVDGAHAETLEIPFDACVVWDQALELPVIELLDVGAPGVLVFTGERGGIWLHDGDQARLHYEFASTVGAVWGDSPERFYLTVDRELYELADRQPADGQQIGHVFLDAWVLADDDVLLAGTEGTVGRWRGGELEVWEATRWAPLTGIWASAPDRIFVVGNVGDDGTPGKLLAFDGDTWAQPLPDSAARLNDVWGSGPEDVVVVGQGGTVLRFDGESWSPVETGCSGELRAVGGVGPDQVVAVGSDGLVLRWDGSSWSSRWVLGAGDLAAVTVAHDGRTVVGGSGGLFLQP